MYLEKLLAAALYPSLIANLMYSIHYLYNFIDSKCLILLKFAYQSKTVIIHIVKNIVIYLIFASPRFFYNV